MVDTPTLNAAASQPRPSQLTAYSNAHIFQSLFFQQIHLPTTPKEKKKPKMSELVSHFLNQSEPTDKSSQESKCIYDGSFPETETPCHTDLESLIT